VKKQGKLNKWSARSANLVALGTLAIGAAATQGTAVAEPKEHGGKDAGQAATFSFDIASGPLSSVLEQFRKATGATTPFHLPPEEIAGFHSKGAKGSLTAEAALVSILDSTGLGYHMERNGTRFEIQIQNSEQVSVTAGTNSVALGQFTESLTDTAQSVNVVPQYIMQQQGITSFKDTLKNVPGISLAAGEGGLQGDNLTIRGFSAQKDIYLDGIRDFGSYFRDSFNYESVDVLEGPASVEFGRGSTGGVVNQESKQPVVNKFVRPNVQFGTNGLMRGTLDTNLPLTGIVPNAAFRLNLMGMKSGVAGRDITEIRRVAAAPSLMFGLGRPTRFTLQYMHQYEGTTPDYGVTWLDTTIPVPAVPRTTFYGLRNFNEMNLTPDIATAKLEHDFGSHVSMRTSVRYGRYPRQVRVTEAIVNSTGTVAGVGPALNPTAAAANQVFASYTSTCAQTTSVTTSCYAQNAPLAQVYLRRNNIARNATDDMLWARTEFTSNFTFHGIGNNMTILMEGGRERTTTGGWSYFNADGVTAFTSYAPLLNPNPDDPTPPVIKSFFPTHVSSQSYGINLMDSLHPTRWLIFSGGIRFDYFNTLSSAPVATTVLPATAPVAVTNISRLDKQPTYRAAVVVKPKQNGSVYFDYGTSFNPSAETLSLSANNAVLPPEENTTYEVGTKWDLLHDKLNVNSSIFRTTKLNAKETNPLDSTQTILSGTQRVQGFQLGALGHLPQRFDLIVGYAYLDSRVVSSILNISPFAAVNAIFAKVGDPRYNTAPYFLSANGLPLTNVAKNTGNFWVTHALPWRLTGGFGGNAVGPRRVSSAAVNAVYNTTAATDVRNVPLAFRTVPTYFTMNAMLSRPINEHLSAQVNINNLANKFYIEQPASNRLIPGEGINAQFSLQTRW
jgi:catecholate siderophore receptor